ncbi:hypothetical protein SUGI_1176650 [Cryptomeria japonica]|nr:hypothetical protein SUGI_1176650 [Cryptomeria japonica]
MVFRNKNSKGTRFLRYYIPYPLENLFPLGFSYLQPHQNLVRSEFFSHSESCSRKKYPRLHKKKEDGKEFAENFNGVPVGMEDERDSRRAATLRRLFAGNEIKMQR